MTHPRTFFLACFVLVVLLLDVLVDRVASKWALSELEGYASSLGINAEAGSISIHLLRLTPSVEINNLKVGTSEREALLANADVAVRFRWWDLLADTPLVQSLMLSDVRVNLLVDSKGDNNWDGLFTALSETENSDDEVGIAFENMQIPDLFLEYINDEMAQSGSVLANLDWLMSSGVSDARITITGDVNLLPVSIDLSLHSESPTRLGAQVLSVSLLAQLADSSLTVTGKTDDLASLENGELQFSIDGQAISDTLSRLSLGNTGVSILKLEGFARYYADDVMSANLDLSLDRSHAKASFALEGLRGTRLDGHRELTGALSFTDLFLDKVLGDAEQREGQYETQVGNQDNSKLFSEDQIVYAQFMHDLDIDFKLGVERFYSGSLLVNNMEGAVKKKNDTLSFELQSDDFGEGELQMSLSLDTEKKLTQGKFTARAKRLPLNDILSAGDLVDGLASGKLSGDAKFWFAGNSTAQALGALDGGLFVLLEDGKLDSLMVELAGADLMESIGLVFADDLQQSAVRCGFIDIQAVDGLVSLNDFIIDTEDSIFLASGDVDLGTEKLNLKFSPHPRDSSFFAATTPVHITGSLANPKVRPGSKLYTRMALAAAMVALASPAAVVLPFIELGGGGEQSYCKELFEN